VPPRPGGFPALLEEAAEHAVTSRVGGVLAEEVGQLLDECARQPLAARRGEEGERTVELLQRRARGGQA
jgi:hypothetical protein